MAAAPASTQTLESHALSSLATWTLQPQPGSQSAAPTEPCEQLNENIDSHSLDRKTLLKVASASFSFFCAGVDDGSTGAIIPHVIRDYNVNTAIVSSIYGATFAGWVVAALTNTHLGQYLDLGAMLALGAVLQILAQALRAWMPPFGLYMTTFFLVAVGAAYNDTLANTFVATVKGAHRWLAVIHASFMGGCLVGPFVATAVASAGEQRTWSRVYIFPVGICLANRGFITWAFRDSLTLNHRKPLPNSTDNEGDDSETTHAKGATALIRAALRRPATWLLSLFYFFYIGSQITSNGWVVEYLPILVAILACTAISWLLVPSAKRQGNEVALHEE